MGTRRTDRAYGQELHSVLPAPRWRTRTVVAAAACFAALFWLTAAPSRALAACGNPVACENQFPGDPPTDWQVSGIGDTTIQGYATSDERQRWPDDLVQDQDAVHPYHIDILRLGYYRGRRRAHGRANIKPTATLPQTQPACQTFSATGLIDCGNWAVSASWTVPSNAVSGVYIAHLVRDDTQDGAASSQIPFVVRNDSSHFRHRRADLGRHLGGLQRLTAATASTTAPWPARRGIRSPTRRPTRCRTTGRSTARSPPTVGRRTCATPSIR